MAEPAVVTHAFDEVAPRYDATFTDGTLGRWLRNVVWSEMSCAYASGDTVLDLGCGTGEDACHLAGRGVNVIATDASGAMLEVTAAKARRYGADGRVTLHRLDLLSSYIETDLTSLTSGRMIDGAYSDFGPLNCVPDRAPLARALAKVIKPGGTVIAVVMSPLCPWEAGWYLVHAHPRTAVRRLRHGVHSVVGGREFRVWYPSPRRLRREFDPHFAHVKTVGVGVILPPSDLGHVVSHAPGLFNRLNAMDDRIRGTLPGQWLNDHYLSVFRRRDEGGCR